MYSSSLFLERALRMVLDAVAVFVAALAAVWIRHVLIGAENYNPIDTYYYPSAVVAVFGVVSMRFAGHYRRPRSPIGLTPILAPLFIGMVFALAASFFYRSSSYSRLTVLLFFPLATLGVAGMRIAYGRGADALWRNHRAARRVLIVGRSRQGLHLAHSLIRRPAYYQLVGFVDDEPSPGYGTGEADEVMLSLRSESKDPRQTTLLARKLPRLGAVTDLADVIDQRRIDEVIIAVSGSPDKVMEIIGECMRHKVAWKAVPHTYGLRMDRIWVDDFDGIPVVGTRGSRLVGVNWIVKRWFDIVFATLALIVLSPIMGFVALAVRLSSRGPVLYRQTRIGLNGEPFTMLKFRSMKVDSSPTMHHDYSKEWIYGRTGNGNGHAPANGHSPSANGAAPAATGAPNGNGNGNGAIHKIEDDPRVTFVGRIIRATSLDELPQFWNVLRGDMSVVGPRPPMPYEVDRYTEWHKRRLSVPPGITGRWQVSGRNDISFEEMVNLDVAYIETWRFENDLKIILKTVPAMLSLRGN